MEKGGRREGERSKGRCDYRIKSSKMEKRGHEPRMQWPLRDVKSKERHFLLEFPEGNTLLLRL
jgi:hypothetical protein